jgi:hypothetical protein
MTQVRSVRYMKDCFLNDPDRQLRDNYKFYLGIRRMTVLAGVNP